uniref:Uncharacterized protein n=1 Tax=Molossus molossus TaxID=27622 RepID=A0A7J8DC44_MOLMO|nr:hypothetical protein HJG59_009331 [Molossus molossus]
MFPRRAQWYTATDNNSSCFGEETIPGLLAITTQHETAVIWKAGRERNTRGQTQTEQRWGERLLGCPGQAGVPLCGLHNGCLLQRNSHGEGHVAVTTDYVIAMGARIMGVPVNSEDPQIPP